MKNGRPQMKDVDPVELLRVLRKRHEGQRMPLPHVMMGLPETLVERKVEWLCDRGLADYGVSVRTAWPTKRGLEMIDDQS